LSRRGDSKVPSRAEVRRRAEEVVAHRAPSPLPHNPAETARTLHDLAVHQVELELQLEDLRSLQQDDDETFQQIDDHLEDAFYVRRLDGVVSYVNRAFERIWGRPAATLVGQPTAWLDSVQAEDRDRVAAAWERMRQGAAISEVYRIARPDGAQRWVHSRGFPMLATDGTLLRTVGVVRDVTNERLLEQQLRHAQKMEAVGILASGVAHNLGNMLQATLASLELARHEEVEAQQSVAALDRALKTTKRAATLIRQLMTFARKQDGAPLRPVRLDEGVEGAASLLLPLLGDNIKLLIETGAPESVVMADPVQLDQILLNLAANARDAMPDGGTLTVRTSELTLDEEAARRHGVAPGPHAIVTIHDSGSGMDAATKARLFEPFFTTKQVGKGTGLGLSTVLALTRQLGGCIEVETAPGRGSTFTLCFPSLQGPIAEAERMRPRDETRAPRPRHDRAHR
jgi:PAS domain S-box-containing protein